MATVARDFVSNGARKVRAGRPDGVGLPSKGNARSTSTNGRLYRDNKPSFPQIVFGNMKAYSVAPYEVVGGVFFDVPPSRRGIVPGAKAAKPAATRKPRARRTPPPAGVRPSLASILSKG